MFIVAQSWLHHAASDATRGRIITVFYVAYVLSLGAGSFVLGQSDISGNLVPILATAAVALAIAPVALTRLPQPEPPGPVSVDIAKVWRISPVGLAGMLAVGGLTMTFQGFTPIYLLETGRPKEDVGLVMLAMQVGLVFVQTPLGLLSDRIDRRLVLLIACAGAVAASLAGMSLQGVLGLIALAALLAFWNGCNESLYSLSSALANDRADPKDYVLLSSTQMIAWSVSAFIVPLAATLMIRVLPVASYMAMCGAIAGLFGGFVLVRLLWRGDAVAGEREAFQTITAQVVHPGDYANPDASREPGANGGAPN
jgi:predicted MFS family arabinose efflux permease